MPTLLQLTMFSVFVMHHVASAQNDCGNTSFSGLKGVVTSPDFPLPYPHNLNCTYFIDVGRNNFILLKFLDFDLETSSHSGICMHDWLMITCNETDYENLDFRKRYCGTTVPRTSLRFFNCSVVTLIFYADSFVNGGGFSIEYTVFENYSLANIPDLNCGNTLFTRSWGFIRLPENPTDFPASVKCTYTISTNYTSIFALDISTFRGGMLLDSFANCNRDNITIGCVSDGETELNPNTSNTYCRPSLDVIFVRSIPIVIFNCRMVKISMRSTDYTNRATYYISFTVRVLDEDCGNTSFTGPTGIVTSPQFPLSYPHSLNCFYSIDVDRTKTVSLDFLSFKLEGISHSSAMDDCRSDWLTVSCLSDGFVPGNPYQNGKYCGEKKPMTLSYSNCNSLTLNFVTDSSVAHGGFQLRYTITSSGYTAPNTTDGPDEDCVNTSFTGRTGFITSPRFPLSYPNNLNCVYSIDVDPTKIVVLRFLSFDIEGTSHSSYYMDHCNYDWLMISCLSIGRVSEFPHRNKKYCGEKATTLTLGYSNCESLTLNFVTDSSVTRGGFQLQYTITSADQSDCGDTLFSGPKGVVTSPNFPLPYSNNMNCTYSIDVGRNNSVLLKFENFNLEMPNSADYCKDWLMISCNETTKANPNYNKKYCGTIRWTSSMRFLDCSSLVLEFVSDSSINSSGFVIQYTVVDNSNFTDDISELGCGTTLFTNSSGIISLPINPKNYLATVNCTYTISANPKNYIWFNTFLSPGMQLLHSFQDCDTDSLMIGCVSEGETELNANTTNVFCRQGRAPFYYSTRFFESADCRTLKLSIRSTNYDNRETFRIRFSVYGPSEICGTASFSAPSGVVSSRRLSWHFPKRINCLYTIDSGHLNSVSLLLRFSNIDFQDASCASGWLTITCLVNGTSMAHPIADRKLCGLKSPTTERFPACRSVLLNYSSDYISAHTSFSISYRMGDYDTICGNTSFSAPSGIIYHSRLSWRYPRNVNCLYTIDSGHVNSVALVLDRVSFGYSNIRNASCNSGWLTISCLVNGTSVPHPYADRKLCETMYSITVRFPACRSVLLNYSNDYISYNTGFSIRYSMGDYDPECGYTSFSGPNGFVTSPRFPLSYPRNLNCLYSITDGQRNMISLSFTSFSLEGTSNTTSIDSCSHDWLTVSCLSDVSSTANISSSRRYCGIKTTPLTFAFPSCAVVVLNFRSDSYVTEGGFKVRYTVIDTDSLCGVPVYGPPFGVINLPWNNTDFGFDCNYVINATEPGSISLTIWSISLQSSVGRNCQSDWLLITCINGQTALDQKISHRTCDNLNASTQLTLPSCAAAKLVYHRDSETTGKTFRIEYNTVTNYGDNVLTTELPTTSISPTAQVTAKTSCATGCKLSPDATYCECLPDTSQTPAISVSRDTPVTGSAKCHVGCEISIDGTTCDCSTTHSGDPVVNTQMNLSGKRGHAVGISLTAILVVAGAICLCAFFIFRRHRATNRSEMLQQTSEEERAQMELEDDSSHAGSLSGDHRNQDRDTSDYLPLIPMSLSDRDDRSSNSNSTLNPSEIQPGL